MNCLVRNHRNGHPERTYDASQEEKNKPKTHSFWKNYATNDRIVIGFFVSRRRPCSCGSPLSKQIFVCPHTIIVISS